MKYVWLNLSDGSFSNSWPEDLHKEAFAGKMGETILADALKEGWKLIRFECLNDPHFEFINKMRLR